jgi:hypothetical protein
MECDRPPLSKEERDRVKEKLRKGRREPIPIK